VRSVAAALAAAGVIFSSGCASLDSDACRQANWYDLGFRDAIYGMQAQDLVYAARCEPQGVKLDVALYTQGFREGRWEAEARRSESSD
jgi:uncharacterized protein DUF2799